MESFLFEIWNFIKNPIVLLSLFLFGILQMVVIFVALNSTSYTNRTHSLPHKSPKSTIKIDWSYKTAIKVESLQDILSNKTTATARRGCLELQEVIQYGSEDFQFPLLLDMPAVVTRLKNNETINVKPINDEKFRYIIENKDICESVNIGKIDINLLILIKSTPGNFLARDIIRATWGKRNCWGGRVVRLGFLLGAVSGETRSLQGHLLRESEVYADIIQSDFVDHYYNNTHKLILGLRWLSKHCRNARFIMFIDDDYFVHPRRVVSYLESLSHALYSRLISGSVWRTASPQRNEHSKWFVSPLDYPWSLYPPYSSTGTVFLSADVAADITIAMKYTRFFKFDDVFLGIVLHKLLIVPMHLKDIWAIKTVDRSSPKYRQMISSYGFESQKHIMDTWMELGCANFCQ